MRRLLAFALALLVATAPAYAAPKTRATKTVTKSAKAAVATKTAAKAATKTRTSGSRSRTKAAGAATQKPGDKDKGVIGARARVAFSVAGEMRPAREVVGRREQPLTLEEDIAKQIEKLLRGPLRNGITGLYVADARTGEPIFAV